MEGSCPVPSIIRPIATIVWIMRDTADGGGDFSSYVWLSLFTRVTETAYCTEGFEIRTLLTELRP